ELRAVGARTGVGHGQQVGLVEAQVRVELVLELVTGATGAVAERVTALDHEAADHPVEDRTVVELVRGPGTGLRVGPLPLAPGELDEVLDRLGRVVREEPDLDVAVVGL